MNPVVTLELARLDVEERLRQADARRASKDARSPARVRLGLALQRAGARVAGPGAASVPAVRPRRAPVRVS